MPQNIGRFTVKTGPNSDKQPKQSEDKTDALYSLRKLRNDSEMSLLSLANKFPDDPDIVNKMKNYLHQSRKGQPAPKDLDGYKYEDSEGNTKKITDRLNNIRKLDQQIHEAKKVVGDTSFQPSPFAKEWNTWGSSSAPKTGPQQTMENAKQSLQSQPVQNQTQGQSETQISDDERLKKLETGLSALGQPYRQLKDDYYKQPEDKREKYLQEQAKSRGLDYTKAGKYIKGAVAAYNIRLKKGIIDANGNPIKQATTPSKPQGKAKGAKGNKDTASNRKQFINEFLG